MTTDDFLKKGMTRRTFGAGLLTAALATPYVLRPASAQSNEPLIVVNWGGGVGELKRTQIYVPFTEETGIPITPVYGPEFAKIRAMVKAGDVEWDVVDLLDSWVAAGEQDGLYEPIDKSIVPVDRLMPFARREFEFGSHIYAGGMARSTARFPEDKRPKTWADFWDVEKFPGRRGLRNRIGETLELALLADGVAPKDIYPCDVERAFAALDRIKPNIQQWIAQTPQTTQLIQAGECDFTYTYLSRVYEGSKAGMEVDFSFENNLISTNWIGVIKGTRRKDAAMRFLEFYSRPETQLRYANATGHGPTVAGVREKIDPKVLPWVPNPNNESNLMLNQEWWSGKEEELTRRFREWLMI